MKNFIKQLLRENIYYHGMSQPINDEPLTKFEPKVGYRSYSWSNTPREVNSPWTFFTDEYELAAKFASSRGDMFRDKKIRSKSVILKFDIDESKLNILDLTNNGVGSSNFYFVLLKIGIDLEKDGDFYYTLINNDITSVWPVLDNENYTNLITKAGFNAVRLIENSEGSKSLAILTSIVNDVIKPIG